MMRPDPFQRDLEALMTRELIWFDTPEEAAEEARDIINGWLQRMEAERDMESTMRVLESQEALDRGL